MRPLARYRKGQEIDFVQLDDFAVQHPGRGVPGLWPLHTQQGMRGGLAERSDIAAVIKLSDFRVERSVTARGGGTVVPSAVLWRLRIARGCRSASRVWRT